MLCACHAEMICMVSFFCNMGAGLPSVEAPLLFVKLAVACVEQVYHIVWRDFAPVAV